MANLYEINEAIMACVDTETGEIVDIEQFDSLLMERTEKVENIALWIKNLAADALAYKAEKEAFAAREKQAQAKIESLKRYLASALEGKKFSTAKCAISFRRSEQVEIMDAANIPEDFLTHKETVTPNKTAIKEAIKAGQEVSGCRLVENINPTIK